MLNITTVLCLLYISAADYQRISEQIQRKKKKPVPPLPPQYQVTIDTK